MQVTPPPQGLPSLSAKPTWLTSLTVIGLITLLWLTLKHLGAVLTPFAIALALAYCLAPLVQKLHITTRQQLPRWLLVFIVELLFLLIVTAVLLLIFPILNKELPLLQKQLPGLIERLHTHTAPLLAKLGAPYSLDLASLKQFSLQYVETNWSELSAQLMPSIKLGGSILLTLLGFVILIPIVLFYLLSDWMRLTQTMQSWIPRRKRNETQDFIHQINEILRQYMRGQLLVMLTLAIFYSAGLTLWGLDLALPIGILTGLAIAIPYLGFAIGLGLALLAGLLQFDLNHTLLMLATVYGLGQLLESFFLTPRLIGERIGLHPLAVIFALMAFGQLLGFIGVLIALPASAVLLVAMRRLLARYKRSHFYQHS